MPSRLAPSLAASPVRRPAPRGMSLVGVVLATAILTVALLSHAASVTSGHALAMSLNERGQALETLAKVIERLRADPDWAGLYARLRSKSTESANDTGRTFLKVDTALVTYAATSYYADLVVPKALGTVTTLVQVPVTVVAGVPSLRENAVAPRYGLPYDLNGDGVIDGNKRDTDYVALPIVVRLRWARKGQQAQEVVLSTWLRGER